MSTPDNTLYLDLKSGRVTIELRPDLAPNHVAPHPHLTPPRPSVGTAGRGRMVQPVAAARPVL